MARKWSLATELYANADTKTDAYWMDVMRNQDLTPVSSDSRKPRFTLIVGPSPFSMPRGWEFFLTAPYEGATYISTVLHNAGYPVRIIDVRYDPTPLETAYRAILQGTDVLGICTFEDNFPWVRELMDHAKFARPDIPIICGGSLVTSVPHIFMN
ncbi:MAG TPA: B12-binding domain-containing radical SAM protein, partial [Deltaproteobacteria bacterium]|nr:B12-binding domain-containing radical SAM protein [Deltaproteobacteria bacterium]